MPSLRLRGCRLSPRPTVLAVAVLAFTIGGCSTSTIGDASPSTEQAASMPTTDPGSADPGSADPGLSANTEPPSPTGTAAATTGKAEATTTTQATTTQIESINGATLAPEWLGQRVLPTTPEGIVPPQTTPEALVDRRLITTDTLPPPTGSEFEYKISPLRGEPLARSTWHEGCPVGVDQLSYLTMTFIGFDGLNHTGEMIVHRDVAEDVVEVFRQLHQAKFPIEEMRIVTPADLDAEPTGDGNNTTSFVCRAVVGGTRFSEHASGLAVDVNPFQNPYQKGEVLLPELADSYLDRTLGLPGMILEDGPVVKAFDQIGWGWGGRWSSLDDYHHFSLHNR